MRVLISGGLGFLGSHLVDELLSHDPSTDITIVDNCSSNVIDPNAPDVDVYVESIQSFLSRKHKHFAQVYHCASIVGPTGVIPHGGRIAQQVINDAYILARHCLNWEARLLDVSTSEVYGGGESGYCGEWMAKIVPADISPRLEYAVGKLAAEVALVNTPLLDTVIVRPFNIAGPRQSTQGGFVIPRFVEQALTGEPLTIYGNGRQVRAFTHVRDMARGLRLAMERGVTKSIYNLGAPQNRTSINELAKLVLTTIGSDSSIQYVDPRFLWGKEFAEAADKFPDSKKANEELGWYAQHSLVKIVQDAVDDIVERRLRVV